MVTLATFDTNYYLLCLGAVGLREVSSGSYNQVRAKTERFDFSKTHWKYPFFVAVDINKEITKKQTKSAISQILHKG